MDHGKNTLKPKDIYRPFKARGLTTEGAQALAYLYQPVTGSDAIAVYQSLLGDAEDDTQEEFLHMDAFTALDMGSPRFLAARQQLEGLGLLKVYVKEDRELGPQYLYELMEPMAPVAFFQDERYCQLLLAKVSRHKFNQLAQRFAPKTVDMTSYRQITKRFAEVYGKAAQGSGGQLANQDIKAATTNYQQLADVGQLQVTLAHLDWPFMKDLAEKEHLVRELFTEELREKLAFYHEFYGYQELELIELLGDAVVLSGGQLNLKKLDQVAEKRAQEPLRKTNYPAKNEVSDNLEQVSDVTENDLAIRRRNQFLAKGYTEADWQAIQAMDTYPPLKYLQGLKKAKRSFVTKNEEWLLKDLVAKSPLPNPVINQLMNYVLVDQNKSDLNARLVNTIATDWSEKQLKTPEAALDYVRQRKLEQLAEKEQKEQRRQANNKRFGNNRPQKTEKLEDWSQYQVQTNPELEAELDRKMKEFLEEEGEK